MKKIAYFIPAVLYYSLIFYLSSKRIHVEVGVPLADKMAHLFEFAVLAIFLFFGFSKSFKTTLKIKVLLTSITGILLSLSDELHQYFVPRRHFDILDAVANIVGVLLGIVFFLCVSQGVKLKIFR